MKLRTLGVIVIALFVLAACGEEGGDTTTTGDAGQEATTTTAAPEPTTTAAEETATTAAEEMTTTSAAEMADGVHVAETDLGAILVDPDGFTLYIFTQDTEGESVCVDDCAATWPPVPADTPIGSDLDSAMFGSITRADGSDQLTVNGMPLYLFAPDENPGDTNGQGVNDVWFVVDASGNMLEAAADTSAEEEDVAYDYDY